MKIVDKAWKIQFAFERFMLNLPDLKVETYLMCNMFLFMFVGMCLLIYIVFMGLPLFHVAVFHNPLFYFGLSVSCAGSYLFLKLERRLLTGDNSG